MMTFILFALWFMKAPKWVMIVTAIELIWIDSWRVEIQ